VRLGTLLSLTRLFTKHIAEVCKCCFRSSESQPVSTAAMDRQDTIKAGNVERQDTFKAGNVSRQDTIKSGKSSLA